MKFQRCWTSYSIMDRSVKSKQIESTQGRTIVISDIHANLDGYLSLLEKVHYQKNKDRLIILGDFIEKGTQNLDLLHLLMKQNQEEDVYCVMGNCDFVCKMVLYSYRLDFLKMVLTMRKESIIHEMAQQINTPFHENIDMELFCQRLRQHFLKELSFCNDCVHVIETPDTIYAHAAIQSETHFGDDFKEVMNEPFFLEKQKKRFKKRVVVGHMPVSEYCHRIASFYPIYDAQTNIFSIDGGNVVKKYSGQLNALIFENNKVYVESVDTQKEVQVLCDSNPDTPLPLYVTWNQRKVDILESHEKQSLVYSKYLKRKFYMDNAFLSKQNANEYTNYQMPLKKGEMVKIVFEYDDKVQIKKNGVLGWTYRSYLDLD